MASPYDHGSASPAKAQPSEQDDGAIADRQTGNERYRSKQRSRSASTAAGFGEQR
jgi:hypothetical protein